MVSVLNRSSACAYPGCTKRPLYGVEGSKAEFCVPHAKEGMVRSQKSRDGPKISSRERIGGDVRRLGASAADSNVECIVSGKRRKAFSPVPAQVEAASNSERSSQMVDEEEEQLLAAPSAGHDAAGEMFAPDGGLSSGQCAAAVKVEGGVAMSSLSGAAVAVRRTTSGNTTRRKGEASRRPYENELRVCWRAIQAKGAKYRSTRIGREK